MDEELRRTLEAVSKPIGFEGYSPDWDWSTADRVAKMLGGRIVEDDGPPEHVPGRVY